ncbi:hypothetical protein EDB89DRAFT_1847846 [Lactarius sanguifluus]|nr:hypothetical protein EDB89DRAFT_1847846 [Lactarius sanguifluus]
MADKQELIRNAVAFLTDSKAQASPLAQRVQFLEAKGLTGPEIEEAMRLANSSGPHQPHINPQQPSYGPVYGPLPYVSPHHSPWDWRDYFITAVVSGSLAYGAVALARKYLFPHLQPPTSTAYEEDRDALTAQFDTAEALLKEIRAETSAVKTAVESQQEKVDKATADVEAAVQQMREGESRGRDEMREIREEVNNIREMLPKMIEKNKEAQTQSLGELQQDLKSLKTLLLSRTPSTATPAPPLPNFPPRPSIPLWQLSDSSSNGTVLPLGSSSPSIVTPPPAPNVVEGLAQPRLPLGAPPRHENTNPAGQSLPPAKPLTDRSPFKAKLEDRLRASFTIGDVSNPSTPSASSRVSPAPQYEHPLSPDIDHPLSPISIPLPVSPPPHDRDHDHDLSRGRDPPLDTSHFPSDPSSPPLLSALDKFVPVDPGLGAASASDLPNQHSPSDAPVIPQPSEKEPTVSEEGIEMDDTTESIVPNQTTMLSADIEALQEQLKLMEQRFVDVSASFSKLQAEKTAADIVLHELTSVPSFQDADALRDYLQNAHLKVEISQDEIKRLTGKLTRQDERIEELRETHRLESKSQIELVDELRSQIQRNEALFKATQSSKAQLEADIAKRKSETDQLRAEVEKVNTFAKDEEEKRSKAVSLLKTVRQKLVKAEKDREDALKEMAALKESQKTEHDKEQLDRERLQGELNKLKIEKEVSLADHRAQFEKDLATFKQRSEKELTALRGQFELESIAAKAWLTFCLSWVLLTTVQSNQEQAMGLKDVQIGRLERSVQSLSAEKNNLFDQLQMRQAEVESAQSLLEVLQNQNTELQYQIREKDDRITLLHEELNDARQEQHAAVSDPATSPEVAKLLAAADSRHEAKLSSLKQELAAMEAERVEVEAEWRGKVEVKVQEAQKWKAMVDSTSQSRQDDDGRTQELQAEVEKLQSAARAYDHEVSQLKRQVERSTIDQETTRQQLSEQVDTISSLDRQLEEIKAKELQARTHNKACCSFLMDRLSHMGYDQTLRDELRKVQSSAAILNRQRGPGVGHWGSANNTGATTPSSPTSSQTAGSPDSPSSDEDVNVEYLRNVILQFLEHKEMRPNLVRVLSTILRFTPQETRRLIAKV